MVSKIYSKFATDAELLAASGKLQQEIDQGGGGSGVPIDETYLVHKTGEELISGFKKFLDGASGHLQNPLFNSSSSTTFSLITGYHEEGYPLYGPPAPSIDWENRTLIGVGNKSAVDWVFGGLIDTNETWAIDWHFREAYDTDGNPSINFGQRQLISADGDVTVDWGQFALKNSNGGDVLSWEVGALGDYQGREVLNWYGKYLCQEEGFTTLAWTAMTLDHVGPNSAEFTGSTTVLNWFEGKTYAREDTGAESPTWNTSTSIDWQNRQLVSLRYNPETDTTEEMVSLEWNNRNLFGSWQVFNGGFTANTIQGEVETFLGTLDLGSGVPDINDQAHGPAWRNALDLEMIRFNSGQLFGIIDVGGEGSPEYISDLSLDWQKRMFHGAWGFAEGQIAAYGDPDEETGERPVVGYLLMPGDNGMGFETESGMPLLSATQRRLYGLNGNGFLETSIHWGNRIAYDNIGNDTVRWGAKELVGSYLAGNEEDGYYEDTIVTVNWSGRKLYESGAAGTPAVSLDWQARELKGGSAINSLKWGYRNAYDENGAVTIQWNSNRTLENAVGATVRWGDHELWDTTQFMPLPALNWGSRTLVGDWKMGTISGGKFRTTESQVYVENNNAVTSVNSLGTTGFWVRNAASSTGAGLIRARPPMWGMEYWFKNSPANSHITRQLTAFNANNQNPFEIFVSTNTGQNYHKIFGIGSDGLLLGSPALNVTYFPFTATQYVGGATRLSGVATAIAPVVNSALTNPNASSVSSGYYNLSYKINLYAEPSAYQREFTFSSYDIAGQRMFCNADENYSYLTIPANTSGKFSVSVSNVAVAVTGIDSLNPYMRYTLETDPSASASVYMSGFWSLARAV